MNAAPRSAVEAEGGPSRAELLRPIFAVLAHEHRIRILSILDASGPQRVTPLALALDTTKSHVCQHLRRLGDLGLVERGPGRSYRLAAHPEWPLLRWVLRGAGPS